MSASEEDEEPLAIRRRVYCHSRYNRINQNGPEAAGWRTTAVNLNLNRDYLKEDTVEARAFLGLFDRWRPDFFVDDHVSDGADYQYDSTYGFSSGPDVSPRSPRG